MMRYARTEGVVAERSGDRTVVLDSEGSALITLNPVGTLLWERLPCDLDGAVRYLRRTFPDVCEDVLLEDATAFFRELLAHSLISGIDAEG